MKTQEIIKLLVSAVLGLIIDQAFSISEVIRGALEPFMTGPFLEPIKPLIILLFFLIEITAVYLILDKLKIFEKLIK
jgi:hypothetical protein